MKVVLPTIYLTEQDCRALRFFYGGKNAGKKTPCSREEALQFFNSLIVKSLKELRYRWYGDDVPQEILDGADPTPYLASLNGPAVGIVVASQRVRNTRQQNSMIERKPGYDQDTRTNHFQ